jgi:NitT/TauT family transport system substrate-binding protein
MSRRRLFLRLVALALIAGLALGGCNLGTHPNVGATNASRTPLVVGLGYIPSVQFAPFYLAQQAGYYRDAGLDVTFQNKIETDLIPLVGQGAIDIGVADGTDVIPAVSQGIPVRYLATLYGQYPSIVFAKASSGIKTAADLKGRKIGIPGKYGSSWIMLQALLGSAGLTPADVTVVEYPDFGQGVAVQQGAVDAATGFANNEPVQLELSGTKTIVLHVDQVIALPGPGLIAGSGAIKQGQPKRAAVAAFVKATIRAMTEIAADPAKGLDASIAAVPELGANRATQSTILAATIATWAGPVQQGNGFGAFDRAGWAASIAFMTKLGLVKHPVTIGNLIVDGFIPSQGPIPSPGPS